MTGQWTSERVTSLFERLSGHVSDAQELRRRLHADPRVSGDEDDTTRTMLESLGLDGVRVETGGAIVRIGSPEGPAIGMRAEMDALTVLEETGVEWASTNGAMHACGHDVHLAGAYAVARTLAETEGPLPMVLVLQPREETYPSGGEDMTRSAELLAHDLRAFVGAHVQPRLREGTFAATPGPVNAASDRFQILVNGRPGHAAYPHLTADPVVAAADLVGTLQHLISRQVDPTNPTVLTIGSINGGNAPNVVPSAVLMKGTLRTFDEEDRSRLHRTLTTSSEAVAGIHGCDAEVRVVRGAPVLTNDVHVATAAEHWIEKAGLEPAPPLRSCGADDFSFYCSLFPSLMVFVGVGPGGPDVPGLHHPRFLPPERAVEDVARVLLAAYLGACSTVADLPLPA